MKNWCSERQQLHENSYHMSETNKDASQDKDKVNGRRHLWTQMIQDKHDAKVN